MLNLLNKIFGVKVESSPFVFFDPDPPSSVKAAEGGHVHNIQPTLKQRLADLEEEVRKLREEKK